MTRPSLRPVFTFAFLAIAWLSTAQPGPGEEKNGVRPGHQLLLHTALHVPWGDLADRFGPANTVGIGWRRTAASGWRYGVMYRFQTGAR